MTQKQIILRPTGSSIYRRRQPLLRASSSSSSTSSRIAEAAGGTIAECVAVSCCCPCAVVNLLVLVVYKVPAGICRKALRNQRRRRMFKKGLLPLPSFANSSRKHECNCNEFTNVGFPTEKVTVVVMGRTNFDTNFIVDDDFLKLDEEMWDKFYATGFWRSPSQRER